MTVPEFDPARSAAIRDGLSRRPTDTPRRAARWITRLGIGLAALLAGALVTTGAWASGWFPRPDLDQPVSSLAGADGVIPGAPNITLLGDPVTQTVDGSLAIDLAPPREATHVRVRVSCLAAGSVGFGFDPTNTPSMTCTTADIGDVTWIDLELPADPILHIVAAPQMRSAVDYEFAIIRGTSWATNAAGETYGVSGADGDPVLIAAVGVNDAGEYVEGYIREADATWVGYPEPKNPEEAGEYMEYVAGLREQYPGGYPVPVYESDGVTQIGWFLVGL